MCLSKGHNKIKSGQSKAGSSNRKEDDKDSVIFRQIEHCDCACAPAPAGGGGGGGVTPPKDGVESGNQKEPKGRMWDIIVPDKTRKDSKPGDKKGKTKSPLEKRIDGLESKPEKEDAKK